MDEFNFDLGFNKPNFQQEFGGKTGTLSEKRTEETSKDSSADIAGIIDASAGGLDSIANMASMFMGKPSTEETNHTATASPEKKKVSPWLWIGGGVLVLLLITLLISSKNESAKLPEA